MSKTLTEQWKDGKLEKGTYWCINSWTDEIGMFYFEGDYFIDCDVPLDDDNIEEVLAPVPSYDEYKQLVSKTDELEKKLEIATKVLKEANDIIISGAALPRFPVNPELCRNYLEKWGVK